MIKNIHTDQTQQPSKPKTLTNDKSFRGSIKMQGRRKLFYGEGAKKFKRNSG